MPEPAETAGHRASYHGERGEQAEKHSQENDRNLDDIGQRDGAQPANYDNSHENDSRDQIRCPFVGSEQGSDEGPTGNDLGNSGDKVGNSDDNGGHQTGLAVEEAADNLGDGDGPQTAEPGGHGKSKYQHGNAERDGVPGTDKSVGISPLAHPDGSVSANPVPKNHSHHQRQRQRSSRHQKMIGTQFFFQQYIRRPDGERGINDQYNNRNNVVAHSFPRRKKYSA